MSESTKRLPLWPIFVVLSIVLILSILNPICRYMYTKDFVARGDVQSAEFLADNLESAGITNFNKPMFFIGSSPTKTNASCLDLSTGKYKIFSIFDAADVLNLDTVDASQYIVAALNKMGYSYTAPTSTDWGSYSAEINAHAPLWKSHPWYDSVLETEHCIIVQLTPHER